MKTNFNDLKCVWMDAGLLDLKLCDRNFDCENCELDKFFKDKSSIDGKQKTENYSNYVDFLYKNIEREKYYNDLIYLKNGLVVKNIFNSTYYLGFSYLTKLLIDDDCEISFCVTRSQVEAGEKLLQIKVQEFKIDVIAPIKIEIVETIKPSTKVEFVKRNMSDWLAVCKIDPEDFAMGMLSRHSYKIQKKTTLSELNLIDIPKSVGETLYDGGTMITNLRQIIGNRDYFRILRNLLKY